LAAGQLNVTRCAVFWLIALRRADRMDAPICSEPLHKELRAFDSMNTGTEIALTTPIKPSVISSSTIE
jgi:hypothetical protein